jgi:uncharacterized membrane protein (UPF0127 family)
VKATNLRNGMVLATNVVFANSLLKRMKGLLGKKNMQAGEALLIKPCMSIHTVGMRFPIDVAFLNTKNKVTAIVNNLKPQRITRLYFKAISVLELPAGTLNTTDTRIGDEIDII